MYSALIPDPGPKPLPEMFLFYPTPHWFFVLMAGSAVIVTLAAGMMWLYAVRRGHRESAKGTASGVLVGIIFVIVAAVAAVVTPIGS